MNTDDLNMVLSVAELGSITAAAARLNKQVAAASAAIKRVERALGAELFVRSTRHLRLSGAGERYIPQCKQALAMLNIAEKNLREEVGLVEGELRISVSSDLGRNIVSPWLDEILDAHPKVSLKLDASDSSVDFYRDAIDVAIRYGSPKEANVYGYKICTVPRVLCASQGYLERFGTPKHPNDLAAHAGLFYQLYDKIYDNWAFSYQGQEYKIKMNGTRASNDGDIVRRWCVAGKGIALKSSLDISADLLSGRLIRFLSEYEIKPTELWIVCSSRQSITPAVRLLRDALKEKVGKYLMY